MTCEPNTPLLDIVARHQAVFTAPPVMVPDGNVDVSGDGRWRIWAYAGTKIDAPLLGNGDMLAALAGPPQYPQFWVTTNDFWQMESNVNYTFFQDNETAMHDPPVGLGSPRPAGRLVFDIPGMAGASYRAVQDFATAVTTATFTQPDGTQLAIRAWVSATDNLLVATLTSNRRLQVSASFRFPDETGMGCETGVDFTGCDEKPESLRGTFVGLIGGQPLQVKKTGRQGLISGYRAFLDRVDVPTKVGFAGRFLDRTGPKTWLEPDQPACFVWAMRSWAKQARPYEMACSRAEWITGEDLDALWEQHARWWAGFWSVSGVELDDPLLEQRYYLSQYVLASLSRDPDYPPNILGISTFDRMAWNGNYKINYNHQSPYLGLLVSGHFEQADTHDAPYLAMLDIGQEMSRRLLGHDGVYLPLGLGPAGMVSEPLLLHMKSQAVHGAVNMLLRYFLTRDLAYARKVYPFLRAVAVFWEHDLVWADGHYRVVADGMHERTTREVAESGMPENAVNTLGYLKLFFSRMPSLSADLGLDEAHRARWDEIAQKLSPFPSGRVADLDSSYNRRRKLTVDVRDLLPADMLEKRVFFNEEKGNRWSLGFPGNIMHIYPAGAIGLDSPPELLETARNTIAVRSEQEKRLAEYWLRQNPPDGGSRHVRTGAWNDGNISCLFFPAAVRVGFDPDVIFDELVTRVATLGLPNGFFDRNPHGIENLSLVPNTIQEMMLQSHEGIIRIFPVWPRRTHPNARFANLWANGAFQVSASLRAGTVCSVSIRANRDGELVLQNPWPGHVVSVGSHPVSGDRLTIPVKAGDVLAIRPAN
ncbi:MAG: hypothetical protein PHG76_08765 [Eubacteriales bacterium]|nr:hypothetical protein [Eubacteriales bacterium]